MKVEERFWGRVDKSGECWLWTGNRYPNGYGRVWWKGASHGAHRVAWELATTAWPGDSQVLHRCDNPQCVNPAHLFLGTQRDNMRDRLTKGKYARGDQHPARAHPERVLRGRTHGNAKLTEADVAEIRRRVAAGEKRNQIAALFGVTPTLVGGIVKRRTWRHVP